VPRRERKAIVVLCFGLGLFPRSAGAEPYEDTQHRFRLDLPSGWQPTPAFGDTDGMVFTRGPVRRGGRSATFRVRIGPPSDPDDVLARHEPELAQAGKLQPAGNGAAKLSAGSALTRSYRRGEGVMADRISLHALAAAGRTYLLEAVMPERDQQRLSAEVRGLLSAFQPISAGSVSASPTPRLQVDDLDASQLAGRFRNDDGLVLVLGSDSSFALDSVSGRYEVSGNTLTLIIPGQGREPFTFAFDGAAGTLTLSSPNLEAPMIYRRLGPGQEGKTSTARAEGEGRLVGTWTTSAKKGVVTLRLEAGRQFQLGPHQGQWSADGGTLKLDRGGGDLITYRYQLKKGFLLLSGGDLDAPVRFERAD
jgi:hypothetical protein